MTIPKFETSQLLPTLNELDEPTELASDYAQRIQRELPNFPESVITQLFYDHHHCVEGYSWLEYHSLTFKLATVGPDILNLPCLCENETVVQYRDYFLEGTESPRMKRLALYIKAHGTWPVPPILFDNPKGGFVSPWGLHYSTPYDLLEGHHRMAVLYALAKHTRNTHEIWLLQRSVG